MNHRPLRRTGVRVLLAMLITGAASSCFSASTGSTADSAEVLRVALPWPPAQDYAPYGDDGTILSRLGVTESLTQLDESGAPAPALATDWTRVGKRVWEFELRRDVRFHDGTRLTAQGVRESLSAAASASPVPSELSNVKLDVVPVDADTVRIRTSVADTALPQRLSSPNLPILASAAFDGQVDPRGAGTGPFELTETDGVQGASLTAHQDYWAGEPRLAGLEVRYLPEASSRTAAFNAGEVHVSHTVPISDLGAVGDDLIEVPLPRSVLVYLNGERSALDTAGKRATVAEAVDQELLASTLFEGRADAAYGIFGPASPWAEARPPVPAAPTAEPLTETVRIATYPERAELPQVADAIAAALRDQGIEVEQTVRAYSSLEADLLAGRFDIVVGSRSYLVDTGEPVDYLLSDFSCRGSYNLAQLCEPAVERTLRDLSGETGLAARREASLRTERAVLASGSVVPVVYERARYAVHEDVTGIAEDPFERRFITAETELR